MESRGPSLKDEVSKTSRNDDSSSNHESEGDEFSTEEYLIKKMAQFQAAAKGGSDKKPTRTSNLSASLSDPADKYHMMSILPADFTKWTQSEFEVPIINEIPLSCVYPSLSQVLDCPDYVVNLYSYWYLDIIGAAVDRAQREAGMKPEDQKLLIAWFGHIFNLFREKEWSREEILSNTREEIIALGYNLENISWAVPAPSEKRSYLITGITPRPEQKIDRTPLTMAYITSLIYDVFANPLQFYFIQNYFFKNPEITDIKMPHKINIPKRYKPEPIVTPKLAKNKKDADKKQAMKQSSKNKSGASDRKSNEFYTENINPNAYILPLREAVTDEFFRSIFPSFKGSTPTTNKESRFSK